MKKPENRKPFKVGAQYAFTRSGLIKGSFYTIHSIDSRPSENGNGIWKIRASWTDTYGGAYRGIQCVALRENYRRVDNKKGFDNGRR